jgi:ornithine cyclodeaminase/alanine dehydrogenase-like protein (mu-crystallin family)
MRTAAASALASRTILGSKCSKIEKIGIIGVGIQALWQLR